MARLHAALGLLWLASPATLHAQTALADADAREVTAYRLSTATLQKVAAATKADPRFARLAQLRARKRALEAKADLTEAESASLEKIEAEIEVAEDALPNLLDPQLKTLGAMEARLQKDPAIAAALKSAGLSAREYSTFMLALVQASLVHGLQKSGLVKEIPRELQGQVNLENVKWVAANEAEISRLMAATGTEREEP